MLRMASAMASPDPCVTGHLALETLFAEVLKTIESGATGRVEEAWKTAERALSEHFNEEERTLLADLLASRPREARVVLEEHSYLRRRLGQLRSMLPSLPLDATRTFLDELRAHGRHEERVLYPWAEARKPSATTKTPV